MKKTAIISIIVIMVVAIFAVMISTSNNFTGFAVKKEPVRIGATLSLTGSLSYIGQNEYNGLKMAADEINANGGINGRMIELIAEDNKGVANDAVTGVRKMIDVDNVDVIVSAFTHITIAVAPIVNQSKKVMIYESTYRKIAESSDYIFRDYWDAFDSGKELADFILSTNITKVAYLGELSDTCEDFRNGFISEYEPKGNITTVEKFNPGEKDFRTMIMKIDKTKPQVFVFCTWRDEDKIMPQLKELGLIDKPTFHIVAPFLSQANTPVMNALFKENRATSSWYGTSENNEKLRGFAEKYKKLYNSEPRPDAAFMYDDAYVLSNALRTCDNKGMLNDRNCLANELLKTQYDGVSGMLTFNQDGVSNRDVLLIEYGDNGWETIS